MSKVIYLHTPYATYMSAKRREARDMLRAHIIVGIVTAACWAPAIYMIVTF